MDLDHRMSGKIWVSLKVTYYWNQAVHLYRNGGRPSRTSVLAPEKDGAWYIPNPVPHRALGFEQTAGIGLKPHVEIQGDEERHK